MPQWTRQCAGNPVRRAISGRIGPRAACAGHMGGNSLSHPCRCTREGIAPFPGIPQVAVAADRGQLARRNPGQPPGPVLRIGENAVGAHELLREVALQPEQLAAEVHPCRQGREVALQPEQLAAEVHPCRQGGAAGLGERGSHLGEGLDGLLRGLGLVVEDGQGEPVSAHQGGGAAVGRRHDGVDLVARRQPGRGLQQPAPDPFGVEVRVGGTVEAAVFEPLHREDLPVLSQRQELDVGLAHVENQRRGGLVGSHFALRRHGGR